MTTDHGGSMPHAQPLPDWRSLPRNESTHDTITEGDAVGVLLSNSPVRAWVERVDYERIVAVYGAVRWHWNGPRGSVSILLQKPRQILNVARLVVGEDAKGFVQYADEDRLNLRRANLSVDATKRPRRDGLTKVRAEKAAQLERERAERRALRAERAAKAAEGSSAPKSNRKRESTAPTIRPFVPPPPITVRSQVVPPVRLLPRKPIEVVQSVKRPLR